MKYLKSTTFLLMALFFTLAAVAQKSEVDNSDLPIDPKVKIGKMENGMTYYIRQNAKPENRVELTLAVAAGSILEEDDQQGLAHMLEHMAFNGTKNFEKHEIINFLESIGMKFGPEVNAYTSFDETVYGIKVPLDKPEYLSKGLLVLHDWACGISLEDEEIAKEAGIIEEEWRMGQGANDRMRRQYFPVLLENSLYADRLPIGKMEVVKSKNFEPIKRFYSDWYRPDLMAVVVVGDIDVAKVEKQVVELFSQIPARENPKPKKEFGVPNHEDTKAVIATDKEAQQTMVQVYYKHPQMKLNTHDNYRQSIIHSLYNQMINARLQELMVQENPPFLYGFSGYTSFLADKDAYIMFAMTKPERLRESLVNVYKENERVRKFGFTKSELEREKKSLLKNIEKAYNERNNTNSESFVNEYVQHFLPPHQATPGIEYEYKLHQQYIPEISLNEINRLAEEWLKPENRVIIAMGPENDVANYPSSEELIMLIDQADLSDLAAYEDKTSDLPLVPKKPEPGKIVKVKKDKKLGTETWTLSNGAKVVVKQTDFKSDEVLFRAYSLGGHSVESNENDMSAKMAAEIQMEMGLGTYDKIQLEKYLSDKNVSLTPYINEVSEGFNGRTSPKDIETMLELVYMNFQQPRKDETAFRSWKARTEGMIENNSLSPEQVFRDSIRVIMASNHHRARPTTIQTLSEVDFGKANYIFRNRFSDPSNFTYYFVGNIDMATFKPLVETYIGGLPQIRKEESFKNLGIEKPQGKVEKTIYRGMESKSTVYMNYHGKMEYTDAELMKLDLVGKILSTRLLEVVREEESGVYSIGAYPSPSHYPYSQFDVVIYFGCNPENANNLTNIVKKQIVMLTENGPSADELDKAVQKALREKEGGIKENRYWLNKLYDFDYNQKNPAEFLKYEKLVKKVKPADIQQAFSQFFGHNNLAIIQLMPEALKK
jgi:zinc protease